MTRTCFILGLVMVFGIAMTYATKPGDNVKVILKNSTICGGAAILMLCGGRK